ncbi:MAG: hypothetical protein ACKOYN_12310 [Planctomycetota bacterium]
MTAVLLANAASTLFMTGLIWFVQVVHYPLFAQVGAAEFAAYSRAHQSLTTLVVGPAMLVEALTAAWIALARPPAVPAWLAWSGVALVAAIWISTAALQVPSHARLSSGFDASVNGFLVGTNWIRTACWSLRAAVAIAMLALLLSARAKA